MAVRSRVGLAPAAMLEQFLQERRITQHQKEKVITVKYEKKTKAISPGTCDVHPHPTCTKSYQAALPSLGAALGLV